MKTHIRSSEVEVEEIKPGMRRQILGYDSNLMLVRVYFDTGIVADKHTHPHQQVTYVEKGKFEVEIAGNKEVMEAGDCFIIPSEALHGAICLEEGSLIDTFSPQREDFLEPAAESGY